MPPKSVQGAVENVVCAAPGAGIEQKKHFEAAVKAPVDLIDCRILQNLFIKSYFSRCNILLLHCRIIHYDWN